jgi:hypothetical protein
MLATDLRYLATIETSAMLTPAAQFQRRRRTVEELEADNIPQDQEPDRVRQFPELLKPFGFLNAQWDAMKRQMQSGDELWEFCNEKEMWEGAIGMGLAGVELVRDGQVIATLVTRMN